MSRLHTTAKIIYCLNPSVTDQQKELNFCFVNMNINISLHKLMIHADYMYVGDSFYISLLLG